MTRRTWAEVTSLRSPALSPWHNVSVCVILLIALRRPGSPPIKIKRCISHADNNNSAVLNISRVFLHLFYSFLFSEPKQKKCGNEIQYAILIYFFRKIGLFTCKYFQQRIWKKIFAKGYQNGTQRNGHFTKDIENTQIHKCLYESVCNTTGFIATSRIGDH